MSNQDRDEEDEDEDQVRHSQLLDQMNGDVVNGEDVVSAGREQQKHVPKHS